MPRFRVETFIFASPRACFDLARDLNVHTRTVGATRERVIDGPADGLMGPGDVVTFEAVHLGIRQRLTSKIVEFAPPHRFVDEMQRGPFRRLRHVHAFHERDGGTLMVDEMDFAAPLGPLGRLAEVLFLKRYLQRFIEARGRELKRIAEEQAQVASNPLAR